MRPSFLRALASVAVVLNATAVARPLFGQSAPSAPTVDESRKDEAIEHFTKGVQLMGNEFWDAALSEFVAASALYPLKNARRNAARCLKQLARFDESLAMWESVQELFGDRLKPEEAEEAAKEIAELKGMVATIEIVSTVDGANVVVDGRDRGKTPFAAPITVAAGTRVVRVSKDGYAPFEAKPIVAGRSTVKLEVRLLPLARQAPVATSPLPGGAAKAASPAWPGWVVGGAGVTALAVGAGFGASSLSSYHDAQHLCPNRTGCSADALSSRSSAETTAWVADVSIGAGVVGVGLGTYLLISHARRDRVAVGFVPVRGGGAFALTRSF